MPQGLGQQLSKTLPMSGMEHKQQYDQMHYLFIKSSYSVNILITSDKCQNESIHFCPVMLGPLTLGSGTLLWFTFTCLESSCLELTIYSWCCQTRCLISGSCMGEIPEWCCRSNQPNKSGNHVWGFAPQNWMMKVRSGEWWAKPDVYWWVTYFAGPKWCSKRTRKIKQPCKEYESAGSRGKTVSQASRRLLIILTLTYAESAMRRLSLNMWL